MTVDEETGSQASPRRHLSEEENLPRLSVSSSSSGSSGLSGLDEKSCDQDGHRPSLAEICSRERTRMQTRSRSGASSGIDMARTVTRRETVMSRLRSRPITRFTHPLENFPTAADQIVEFDGEHDPYHPLNWPEKKKWTTVMLYASITMSATWASSAYSSGTRAVAADFMLGQQTATLGTTLFLFGFGIGPLLWAPLSEVYGRRLAVMVPMFVAICFSFGSATAKDFQTLMLTRFFCAFFAAAPVTNTGGVLGDVFDASQRGYAMAAYGMAVVGGPVLGPIVSASVVEQPFLGWRWTEYLTGILQSIVLLVGIIFLDESYPPKLLVYKARRLRHESGNWALHAKFEEWDVSISEMAKKFLVRPIQLLMTPICFLIVLYAAFCYGILYMQLGAVPIIFYERRGWNPLVASLPFINILIGAFIGTGLHVINQHFYNKKFRAAGNRPLPEMRLPPMMIGSFIFSAGQFITGWFAEPNFHWILPCIGLVLTGCGFFAIFQAALNYLVDTFQSYAASAVAANTFGRSCFAGAFPLVVSPLYHNIGIGPGSSVFAGFAALMIPVPFLFYRYGKQMRARSKWSKASVFD